MDWLLSNVDTCHAVQYNTLITDDFKEIRISLDKEIVKNEEATFYARVDGESMLGAGLNDGDLIVIDRSEEPKNGSIAVCFLDGEFTVKRLKVVSDGVFLIPENPRYHPIKVTEESELIKAARSPPATNPLIPDGSSSRTKVGKT